MKKLVLAAVLILLAVSDPKAQKLSIENVHKVSLRNSDAIKEGSEVKGYYFFYISDKIDKKTNEYTLQVTDNNLVKLKDIKFQDSKDVSLLESSFNGTDLIFLLYNNDAGTFEYKVYGADGNQKFSYNRQLTKKDEEYLAYSYLIGNDAENSYKGLYPVDGNGFISNMPRTEGKNYTFQIDFFSTGKRKQWTYLPAMEGKMLSGSYLGYCNGVIYIEILKLSRFLDRNPESSIVGLNLENGRQIFEKTTTGKKYKFYPASMSVMNDGRAIFFGEYFSLNGSIMKDKSLGFAFWGVDEKGKTLNEKYCAWDQELGKFMNVNSKGDIEDFGFMYLHNILQTADGSIYAIGEGYKKVASTLGILSKVATAGGSGISVSKVIVTDMMLIRFDKDFNLKEAKIYNKNANNQELPSGSAYFGTPMLGKMLKYTLGGFDYAYSQANKENTSFTICYRDYVKEKDYKGGTFNSISYNEGKMTTDKINTKTDAYRSWILPGKQGQVLVMDYYKKEKKLNAHFEKLN